MASVNKVILIGNLGRDPEVKYGQSGDAVCSFSIACSETWKDKDGEKQEKTEWVRCVAFKRPAEVIGEYVKKGHPIYIEGRLQTRKYEKDGVEHYTTEVIVDRFQFLKGRDSNDGDSSERAQAPKTKPGKGVDDFDDDIPF
jgi:single-strand DNA-binding protein